ncbi:hypothetical protein [Pseudomonas helleri]|uniref:hypothetical protein n=1 Tax=Pseudomonas helleri TaxID=1608996 RepID=UPI003FD36C13
MKSITEARSLSGLWDDNRGKTMATEYADLEPEDQEIVSNALDRAIATFQDVGLPVESLDHDALLTALVDLFMQASH